MEFQASTSELFEAAKSMSFPATIQKPPKCEGLLWHPAGMSIGFASFSPKSIPIIPLFQTINCSVEKKNTALGNKLCIYL